MSPQTKAKKTHRASLTAGAEGGVPQSPWQVQQALSIRREAEAQRREFAALLAGYVRGLLGAPMTKDDVGLSRERLLEKYFPATTDRATAEAL